MPKVSGIFDYFPGISSLSVEKIITGFLKNKEGDLNLLQNQLYNRILYPQTIPLSVSDQEFDLALLQQALKVSPQKYFEHNFKKIYIPAILLERFPDLQKLTWIFINTFALVGLNFIFLKSLNTGVKNLGTLIEPQLLAKSGLINIFLEGKTYQVKIGSFLNIPFGERKVDIRFSSPSALLLGKNDLVLEVSGGQFGIAIDARI